MAAILSKQGLAAGGGSTDGIVSQSNLKNVEAQRIMAVLLEVQRKLTLIALLPDKMDARLSMVFGEDLSKLMANHIQLEAQYDRLIAGKSFDEKLISDLESQIQASTRTLYRFVNTHPQSESIFQKLRFLKQNKPAPVQSFEEKIQEMKVVLFDRLRTTVEEERARQNQVNLITSKEARTNQEVSALKQELEAAKDKRATEIDAKNEIIRTLKETLRDIKVHAEESTKRLETRSKQKEDLDLQQHGLREKTMLGELQVRETIAQDLLVKNREEEVQMRKKKSKIENEVEAWIGKYDQEMEEKQLEIDDLSTVYFEEKANLDELEQKFNELSREWREIEDDRTRETEKRKKAAREKLLLDNLATRIQKVWRGHALRKELAKKKAKPGSKKGGKKKK